MNLIKGSTRLALRNLRVTPVSYFAGDAWKDRDEAAQKVFISQREKQTLKKLLYKVQKEEVDRLNNTQTFQKKLKELMSRYSIQNEALAAEIAFLHRDLRE